MRRWKAFQPFLINENLHGMEINKILVANRGEIAVRVIRAARELGLVTLAIYSDLDGPDALHCRKADRSLPLRGMELSDTYLNIDKIISLAREHGAQAIHPGYGFLSENHLFARACEENGLVFIGPGSDVIRMMGNKIEARQAVEELGIPVTNARVSSVEELLEQAGSMEYPLLIKAAAGGGGKGMRIVHKSEELEPALETTTREASNYFGNGDVFLEKYIDPARHIEFQVLGDLHGNAVHLNERECSIQRRYQKIIEESPSEWLRPETREKMGEAALRITRELGYTSAGTIEFLVDADQSFYFLEMNTRIQVEHPVTEKVTGIDLVKEQIRIAQGLALSFRQDEIKSRGHAIEARLYAEDPLNQFRPSPGLVSLYKEPSDPAVRVDSSLDGPAPVYPQYDPMLAKLIVWGQDRTEALHHLANALADTSILGIETNLLFLQEIALDREFIENRISTQYCDARLNHLVEGVRKRSEEADRLFYISGFLAATLLQGQESAPVEQHSDPWHATGYWRQCARFRFTMEGEDITVRLEPRRRGSLRFQYLDHDCELSALRPVNGELRFLMNGEPRKIVHTRLPNGEEVVDYKGVKFVFKRWDSLPDEPAGMDLSDGTEHNDSIVVSPMYGKVIKISVKEKDRVKQGDVLVTVDSMKIENNILAPRNARIEKIIVKPGDQVEVNKPLLMIE
jgi:acetyl/propionyl-CoA carboxylase alpha subunit